MAPGGNKCAGGNLRQDISGERHGEIMACATCNSEKTIDQIRLPAINEQ